MNLNQYTAKNYNNKSDHLTMAKQSQNKPNQTQFMVSKVEPTCSELVEPISKGQARAFIL
jgi:hypothetical protein